ncbi:putative membrane protein (DUF2178) [Methanoregula formicica SMSP]|uniref:Putative membrane protein (DUF2178) n=2 Tax=Methanoregula formicica TaxID=882104 RepID=L0HID4_METFS|nr:putative membrane protein (DUF2178) [Methanoregula formicica SMSP]
MLHCEIMRMKTYYAVVGCVIAAEILCLGIAITTGNPVIPALLILAGIAVVWFAKRKVTDVMSDDLSDTIYGKAALNALIVTIIVAAILYAGAMTWYFNSGYGGGFHTFPNGSVSVGFATEAPFRQGDTWNYYLIPDPANMTGEDFWGLDLLFKNGHQAREFPLVFGIGMGFIVLLLTALYAAFSYYYTRKYEE